MVTLAPRTTLALLEFALESTHVFPSKVLDSTKPLLVAILEQM